MIEFFACCKGVLIKGRAFHAPIAPILTSAPMSRRGRGEVLGAPYYYRRGNAVWQWWHGVALVAQEASPEFSGHPPHVVTSSRWGPSFQCFAVRCSRTGQCYRTRSILDHCIAIALLQSYKERTRVAHTRASTY